MRVIKFSERVVSAPEPHYKNIWINRKKVTSVRTYNAGGGEPPHSRITMGKDTAVVLGSPDEVTDMLDREDY